MSIPNIEIITSLELRGLGDALAQNVQFHEWDPERLMKAFAFKVHPRWFHQVHLQDLFRVVGLAKDDWKDGFKNLVDDKFLVSDTPITRQYASLDGLNYQIMYCYRIQRAAHAAYPNEIAGLQSDPPPIQPTVTEVLIPSIVENTRGYIQDIVLQANGCYQNRWFDACSVMIRKLIEILVIAVYEHQNRANHIQGADQNYLMLGPMIDRFLADTAFNLGRETKSGLPLIKALGDRSAHNRHFIAKKSDVDKVISSLRVIVPELLHLSGIKT